MEKIRKSRSLKYRMRWVIILIIVIPGLLSLVISTFLHPKDMRNVLIGAASISADSAASVFRRYVDVRPLCERVMEIYHSVPDRIRRDPGSPEYRAYFDEIKEDPVYREVMDVLGEYHYSVEPGELLREICLAQYDEETSALVYIADPDREEDCLPGWWKDISKEETAYFRDSERGEPGPFVYSDSGQDPRIAITGSRLMDDRGYTYGYVLAGVETFPFTANFIKWFSLSYIIATTLAGAVIILLFSRHLKKSLVEPINDIARSAREYVEDKVDGRLDDRHFRDLRIETGDELQGLCEVLASMEEDIATYEADLTRIVREKERISTELSLANRIQSDMLPSVFPPFPQRNDIDLYASMDPAKEIGGDFYDFFLIDDDHMGIVMADVSGKGIPAALFMMMSKILVDASASMGGYPKEILENMNAQICRNNDEEMFVTVWYGCLTISTGEIRAVNAGHEYPVLRQPGGRYEIMKDRHGFVVGGLPDVSYTEYSFTLQKGGTLFLYTDGVVEANNTEGKQFGIGRMLDALNASPDAAPEELLANVRNSIDLFVGDEPQFDDLTMLALRLK